jgi:hypothetical protein
MLPTPDGEHGTGKANITVGSMPDTKVSPESPKSGQSFYSRLFDDWWAWEIVAAVLGVLCLIAICTILAVFDGHPQPELQWGFTLNAAIALITTIMKACLMTLLMEGIGQLKWIAFTGAERPLYDLNVYDAASRGGFKAFLLLWHMRKRFWR